MRKIVLFLFVLLSISTYAVTYSIVMKAPNGNRVPKILGASGNPIPLTGFDYFDWFGINYHRTWFKPDISTLPNDGSVTTSASFLNAVNAIRNEPLRQATSSDIYIDWNRFNIDYNSQVAAYITRLKSLGIKSMICNTVFAANNDITNDWVNIFKYWKMWYAMVYYMASNHDVTVYEFRNEPHAGATYATWESHWLVAADAMRKAMEDVNNNYGKNLPIHLAGSTAPGVYWDYSLTEPDVDMHGWDSYSWKKVKYDMFGNYNVNNPWNYGMYDYHRYGLGGEYHLSSVLRARNSIATAQNDPNGSIPIIVSEMNTSTGGDFTSKKKDTEDLQYGIGAAQILAATGTGDNGALGLGDEGGIFFFKLNSPDGTIPAAGLLGLMNRVTYVSKIAPYNCGGITRGGACFQLYAKHFRDGKKIVPYTVVAGEDILTTRTIAAIDEQKGLYYIYGSTTATNLDKIEINLSALDVKAGAPVTIHRVDAANTGQITEVLTLDASKALSFSVSGMNAYFVTVPMGNSTVSKTVISPTDDTMLSVTDKLVHGTETKMNISINSTNSALRKAAFVRFKVENTDRKDRFLLRLSGKNIGLNSYYREILHVYAVSNKEWSENSLKDWTSGPGVGKYFINSTTMGTADGLGNMIDIEDNYAGTSSGIGKGLGIHGKFVGAISFSSSAYKTNYLDVTDYIKSNSTGSNADVTFVIASIVRYNVNHYANPYYYTLGDYYYNGRIVEIASKENTILDNRPAIVEFADENANALVEPNIKKNLISVYPNPVHDVLNIKHTGNELFTPISISLYNSIGHLIEVISLNSSCNALNVRHLSSGLYHLVIKSERNDYKTVTFSKS
jgi:hypothetical protein